MPRRLRQARVAARRIQRQGFEYLETRRLLNAAPMAFGPPAALWAAASGTAQAARTAAFDELASAGGPRPPMMEVIFIAAPSWHGADKPFAANLLVKPLEVPSFAGAIVVHLNAFKPSPANLSIDGQVTPAFFETADPHGTDADLERLVLFAEDGWQPGQFGVFGGPDGAPFDSRPRAFELLRALPEDVRLAMSPLDGVRAPNGALEYFDSAADVERHTGGGVAVVFGQSAEGEAAFSGGRAIGGMLWAGPWGNGDDIEPIESAERGAVGFLVAFDEALRHAAGDAYFSAVQAAQKDAEQAVSALIQDVLAPRFAFDAAALTVAIDELAAEANELGAGLLEMMSPLASSEAALVAGVVGAGLAYRHLRGPRRGPRAEEEELLASRFIRGPASIRLGGGNP